jgi:hypothetical protein
MNRSVLLGLEFISETSVNTVLFPDSPLEVARQRERGREGRERTGGGAVVADTTFKVRDTTFLL